MPAPVTFVQAVTAAQFETVTLTAVLAGDFLILRQVRAGRDDAPVDVLDSSFHAATDAPSFTSLGDHPDLLHIAAYRGVAAGSVVDNAAWDNVIPDNPPFDTATIHTVPVAYTDGCMLDVFTAFGKPASASPSWDPPLIDSSVRAAVTFPDSVHVYGFSAYLPLTGSGTTGVYAASLGASLGAASGNSIFRQQMLLRPAVPFFRPPLAHRQRRDGTATAGPPLAHIGTPGSRPPLAQRQQTP